MGTEWMDRVVGERMTVDREFSTRIQSSRFSSQEWSLIMTATEFEIENPEAPDTARLVANTDGLEHVLPELENVRSQTAAMGGAPGGDSSGSSGGGLFSSIKGVLGLGGGGGSTEAEREAAETLTQEYAEELQSTLEEKGRWEQICSVAAT